MDTGFSQRSAGNDAIGAFKRYGFAVVGLPALVVSIIVALVIHGVVISNFGKVFATGSAGTVAEAYDAASFGQSDAAEEYAHFDSLVQDRLDSERLLGYRLLTVDGKIVYTTGDGQVGDRVPLDASLLAAVEKGEISSELSNSSGFSLGEDELSVLVVGPLRFGEKGSIAGAFQVLKPYSTVLPSLRTSISIAVLTILLGAVVAYSLLRWLVARAEGQIHASERMVDEVNARLGSSLTEMERHLLGTLQTLNAAVDAKDRYTALHSLHVADYACALGAKLDMTREELVNLERAGLLHDVGKIGVAENALQKPGPLTPEEYEQVKDHSRIGATMIETIPFLSEIIPAITHHHERWDGGGYPDGLSGEDIPRLSRMLTVADAFDAMTSSRPYRSAMGVQAARIELIEGKGTQFDPELVDAFVELIDREVIVVRESRSVLAS